MALDRTLAAAFIDNGVQHRILGCRILPFSNWHRMLLQAVHSPFLLGQEVRFFDMREAAGICRLSFPESKVRRPWLMPILCFLWYGFPRKRWTRFLERTRDRILEYFGDYISKPEYTIVTVETAPGMPLGTIPETFLLVSDVIAFLHCDEYDAWDMPLGRAYWYQMGYYRSQKEQVNFMDESERQFQDELRKKLGGG